MYRNGFLAFLAVCAILIALLMPMAQANTFIDPVWVPIYQGVEYVHGVSGSVHVYAVKVDLWNPNVSLYASHDNGASSKEVLTETGTLFNSNHGCKVAVNASYCDPTSTGQAATNVDVWGLAICDGVVVSPGYTTRGAQYNCQMRFTADKVPSIELNMDTPTGIHTAVTGNAYHLVDGYPMGATTGATQRTSFGLSQDNRYLYMACITSATIYNASLWMLDLGAWNAINMDGGGSTCMTRADIGKVYPSGTERRVGIHLGIRSLPLINPPYMFDYDSMGFTPGNSASPIYWIGDPWSGSTYFDQTGDDCFVYGPSGAFGAPQYPQVINVSLYEQNGNTNAHNMQAFWKSNAYNWWDGAFSSPVVNFTAQNAWTAVNLDVNNAYWYNQTINQLRIDFDQVNTGTRHIVNHAVVQNQLWWTFDGDTMGWTAGNGLTAPYWEGCCGWPGILVTDQVGTDAFLFGRLIGGEGLPFNYLGAANDKIHVRIYPYGGNTSSHDMQVFWIKEGDHNWTESKSTLVYYTGQNQWVDVILPVGQNSNWWTNATQIQQLRLDLDSANTGTRFLIDYIRTEH